MKYFFNPIKNFLEYKSSIYSTFYSKLEKFRLKFVKVICANFIFSKKF